MPVASAPHWAFPSSRLWWSLRPRDAGPLGGRRGLEGDHTPPPSPPPRYPRPAKNHPRASGCPPPKFNRKGRHLGTGTLGSRVLVCPLSCRPSALCVSPWSSSTYRHWTGRAGESCCGVHGALPSPHCPRHSLASVLSLHKRDALAWTCKGERACGRCRPPAEAVQSPQCTPSAVGKAVRSSWPCQPGAL